MHDIDTIHTCCIATEPFSPPYVLRTFSNVGKIVTCKVSFVPMEFRRAENLRLHASFQVLERRLRHC